MKTFFSGDFLTLVFTTPFFYEVVHGSQFFPDLVGVSSRFINFVYCEYNGYSCRTGVIDCLNSLRHDVIIGCNNDDGNIRYLGTSGTHGGKRLVSRGI